MESCMQKLIGECSQVIHLWQREEDRVSMEEADHHNSYNLVVTTKASADLMRTLRMGMPFRVVPNWNKGGRHLYSHVSQSLTSCFTLGVGVSLGASVSWGWEQEYSQQLSPAESNQPWSLSCPGLLVWASLIGQFFSCSDLQMNIPWHILPTRSCIFWQ